MTPNGIMNGAAAPWWIRLPYPIRSVRARWKDLLAMMIGVGIALGISMLMLGVSKASADLFVRDFADSGANLYVLDEGGKLIPILPGDSPGIIQRGQHTLRVIRSTPGVQAAIGVMSWPLERQLPGPRERDAPTTVMTVMGVDGDPTTIPGAVLVTRGRWLTRSDELVLGARLSRQLGLDIGDSVSLNERNFAIVGIGRLRGAGLMGSSLAFMDRRALLRRASIADQVQMIMVYTTQPATLRERLAPLDEYRVAELADARIESDAALAADNVGHTIFIGLTLAIAGLFVSSVLTRSVARRRTEFATLRAIGIPRRTILLIVVTEALIISLVAGLLGMVVSAIMGEAINGIMAPAYGLETLYVSDPSLLLSLFVMATGLGLVAGLAPARQAVRVDPVDVLREA